MDSSGKTGGRRSTSATTTGARREPQALFRNHPFTRPCRVRPGAACSASASRQCRPRHRRQLQSRRDRYVLWQKGQTRWHRPPLAQPRAIFNRLACRASQPRHSLFGAVFDYGAGRYTMTRQEMGTRYGSLVIRILANPKDPEDMKQVHALQDAIEVEQKSSGKYETPNFDPVSQKKVRDALLVLGTTILDNKRMFGGRTEVDPVRHLIGSAMLWGGLPEKDALYLNITPENNDRTAVYKLNVPDVPVDGFWSITVYNAKGYLEPNRYSAYSLNNI